MPWNLTHARICGDQPVARTSPTPPRWCWRAARGDLGSRQLRRHFARSLPSRTSEVSEHRLADWTHREAP